MAIYHYKAMQREDVCSTVRSSTTFLSSYNRSLVFNDYWNLCRRDSLSWDDALNLASFLGEQLRNLHLLPHPPFNSTISSTSYTSEAIPDGSKIHPKWDVLIKILNKKRKGISDNVKKWYVSLCHLNGLFTFSIHWKSNIDQMANLKFSSVLDDSVKYFMHFSAHVIILNGPSLMLFDLSRESIRCFYFEALRITHSRC